MGTLLNEIDEFTNRVKVPNPFEPVRAGDGIGVLYTIEGVDFNGNMDFTGLVTGARVRCIGGASHTLDVTVSGTDITIQPATDGAGVILSTAAQVLTKYLTVAAATTLATLTIPGTGLSLVGLNSNFLPLTNSVFGSIRPALRALTNRTRYLFNGTLLATKTFKGLFIDGTGNVNVPTPVAGEGIASAAWRAGLVASQNLRHEPARLKALNVGTGAGDGNPPSGTALHNELRAKTMMKSCGTVITNGAGAIATQDGANFVADINSGKIRITFADGFADTFYSVTLGVEGSVFAKPSIFWEFINSNSFFIVAQNNGTDVDPATVAFRVGFHVLGTQA